MGSNIDFSKGPLVDILAKHGFELDQRLQSALRIIHPPIEDDAHIFKALYKLNSISARHLIANEQAANIRYPNLKLCKTPNDNISNIKINNATKVNIISSILNKSIDLTNDRRTLGTGSFILAILELGLEKGDNFPERPFTIDYIAEAYAGKHNSPLLDIPGLRPLLDDLRSNINPVDDYQYFLTLDDNDRIAFRTANTLGDFAHRTKSNILVPRRAIITSLKETFGACTIDEIEKLEFLLNSNLAREIDFQIFFTKHPHFFRQWDYREIYPHICLSRPEGNLIPDFLLTDRELQRAAILELKLPTPKIIVRQNNRDRFTAAILEARAQLLTYREWFRDSRNRELLKTVVEMDIYEPRLIVLIGRASEFNDEMDRQRLNSQHPDIKIVTYDDLLVMAHRRLLNVRSC